MTKFHSVASLTSAFEKRFAQSGTVDLQAGSDPDFGHSTDNAGNKVETIAAAGVLSFNNAGKTKTAKALKHFMVLGETVKEGELVELPEADFKRMEVNGQVAEASDEDIAAAQAETTKATKSK